MRIINFSPGRRLTREEKRHLITSENMRLEFRFRVKPFRHFHFSNGYFLTKFLQNFKLTLKKFSNKPNGHRAIKNNRKYSSIPIDRVLNSKDVVYGLLAFSLEFHKSIQSSRKSAIKWKIPSMARYASSSSPA